MVNLQGKGKDSSSSVSLRPPMTARERSNSFRRKASIDSQTGQPHHYHHRRHHHHDPTRGRSPSPPEGATGYVEDDDHHHHEVDSVQPIYKYNADGFLIPTERPVADQSWSSFLVQHQLVLSCSVIMAVVAAHVLIASKEARDGHRVDWIASMNALIPPPLWERFPKTWTNVTLGGGPAMAKKWVPKAGAYDPNQAWSSLAMALQYQQAVRDPRTGEITEVLYGKGWNDLYMILVWVMIWTAVREAAMTYLLIPLGQSFGVGGPPPKKASLSSSTAGAASPASSSSLSSSSKKAPSEKSLKEARLKRKKEQHAREGKLLRFAEQGWLVLYDGCMWTFGMCLLYQSQYWSDTSFYWRDYPKTLLSGTMKWYYLIQFAFWLQQLLLAILGIEKRRKDFLEFMIHHIVTCLLIGFSYSFNLTSVGHAVLCAMDFSDIVLSACKMLKYMHKDTIADVGFVFFVITWVLSRHYYFGIIIWSTAVEAPQFANQAWNPAQGLYFTPRILNGFLFLLCALYTLLLFWLAMIARVVVKVLKGENSEDVRSEAEEEEAEEAVVEKEKELEMEDVEEEEEEEEELPLLKATAAAATTRPIRVSA